MCTGTILDASVFSLFDKEAMKPWRRWVEGGHGVIVYTLSGRFGRELKKNPKIKDYVVNQRRAGARLIQGIKLEEASMALKGQKLKSNDHHMLKLAVVSKAGVLCTDDNKLKFDYRNIPNLVKANNERGAVYPHKASRKSQEAFLAELRCERR